MHFNSFEFLLFFAAVFPLYSALRFHWQNRLLLVASYVFYAAWDWRFLSLIILSTLVDFYLGPRIEEARSPRRRKLWLLASLGTNLGILGFFKYCNFFLENAGALLSALGMEGTIPALQIMLPYGISFYTFHEISYTVDVYRGERKAVRDLTTFACFIAFFPQLVAGPIGRASTQLPQFERPRRMTWDGWCQGATLFLFGLFRKVAVADVLGPPVGQVFADPAHCSPGVLLFGAYGFALQVYADFSGYSDMARGIARIMGFELIENFNQPYFASNITDFWRRWHISLSTWLRDYLYIPLGGSRNGEARTYRNLFVTMFLGGLWHGASWNFAVWGSLHGVYLAVHKLWLRGRKPVAQIQRTFGDICVYLLKMAGTFHLVLLAWVFFASKTLTDSMLFLRGLCGSSDTAPTVVLKSDPVAQALVAAAVMFLLIDLPQFLNRNHGAIMEWGWRPRAAVFTLLTLWLLFLRGARDVPFIYFQF
jgi:D-alanyl-lipoteichoic acid acyltransferase DltB (MBOAT superfamily)